MTSVIASEFPSKVGQGTSNILWTMLDSSRYSTGRPVG